MKRRNFITLAAVAPATAALRIDVASVPTRKIGKIDIVYKSPHSAPNGLQATPEGLWVLDQQPSNYVSLVNYADGKVIREFQVAGLAGASGITVDAGNAIWINDTHNSLIVSCDAQDGKILAKYWCPGAGRAYRLKGDPPATRSPLTPAYEPVPPAAPAAGRGRGRGAAMPAGQVALTATSGLSGEGGQGMEYRDGLLYFSCLPTRRVYVLDPKTWEVQATWDLPGNRAHGVGWEGSTLWVADTNWRAFFRHDMKTGAIVEKIQLTEKDPLIHGVTVHDGYMWFCDDVGYVCNFKL
jgi:streptogramin lyase